GLACHGFRQQGLPRSRRTDQEHPLRNLRTDLRISLRIMQEVHDLLQRLFRFLLSRYIAEGDPRLRLNIHLRIALAEGHRIVAAKPLDQPIHEELSDGDEDDERQDPGEEERDERGILPWNDARKMYVRLIQAFDELRII